MAAQQLAQHGDDQVVGAGLGIDALRAGLAERGAGAVDEDDVAARYRGLDAVDEDAAMVAPAA